MQILRPRPCWRRILGLPSLWLTDYRIMRIGGVSRYRSVVAAFLLARPLLRCRLIVVEPPTIPADHPASVRFRDEWNKRDPGRDA